MLIFSFDIFQAVASLFVSLEYFSSENKSAAESKFDIQFEFCVNKSIWDG